MAENILPQNPGYARRYRSLPVFREAMLGFDEIVCAACTHVAMRDIAICDIAPKICDAHCFPWYSEEEQGSAVYALKRSQK